MQKTPWLQLLPCLLAIQGCDALLGIGDEPGLRPTAAPDAEPINEVGSDAVEASCRSPEPALLGKAKKAARTAAGSNVVRSCVFAAMQAKTATFGLATGVSPYEFCSGDPFGTASREERYDAVAAILRGGSDFVVPCTTHAPKGTGPEISRFASYLAGEGGSVSDPGVVAHAAGILWHLAIEEHGFGHGHDDDEHAAYVACAPAITEGSWSRAHTMPFLVEQCVSQALTASAFGCPALSCSENATPLLRDLDGAAHASTGDCVCVEDPERFGRPLPTFYDDSVGILRFGALGEDSRFTQLGVVAIEGRPAHLTAFAMPFDERGLVSSASGWANVRLLGSDGTAADISPPLFGFAPGWRDFVALPNERLFVYDPSGRGASVAVFATGLGTSTTTLTVPSDADFVVSTSYDGLLFIRDSGTGETATVAAAGSYTPKKSFTIAPIEWTHVVSAGDEFVLSYRSTDGFAEIGRVNPDGSLLSVSRPLLARGWERIAATFDGRYLMYSATEGKLAIYRMRPDGRSPVLVSSQSGVPKGSQLVVNK